MEITLDKGCDTLMKWQPESLLPYLRFDSKEKNSSNWRKAQVSCTCGGRSFSICYKGVATRSLLGRIALFPTDDGSLHVAGECINCGSTILLFAQHTDGDEAAAAPQLCPKCGKNRWRLEMELEYPKEEDDPSPPQCQWERISLECTMCGYKARHYLDLEIE